MSIPWQECKSQLVHPVHVLTTVISQLQKAPEDLSFIPDPVVDDEAAYTSALTALSPPAQIYGASFIDPTPEWSEEALEWTRSGGDQSRVVAWISQALAKGIFESGPWFEALRESDASRRIIVQWGKDDLQVGNSIAT
jgi:hypothetical protein